MFALPDRQWQWQLELALGARVAEALAHAQEQAAADPLPPSVDWQRAKVGIFGRACDRDVLLSEGDRVEIYRSLAADPKDSRRERAKRLKKA